MQQGLVEGLLIDVADYQHVPQGPGILLVGHDVDYGVDETGFVAIRKRQDGVSAADQFRDALRMALGALRVLENDGGLAASFDPGQLRVAVMDRLYAPNTDEGAAAVEAELAPVLAELFGDAKVTRVEADDPRAPVTLELSVPGLDVDAVLAKLPTGAELRIPYAAPQSDWDITAEQLKELRESGSDLRLIDVREQGEFDTVNLAGELIPLGTIEAKIPELAKDAHIVVHCKAGGRGAEAVKQLRKAGFENAWNLRGGILAWIDRIDSSLPRY
jgi:rhodanese-related sulfurtransferase